MTPACADQDPRVFDSTDWGDHTIARAICDTCPAVTWCLERALHVAATSYGGLAPDGTWAGQLWRNGRIVTRPRSAECGTERGYHAHRSRSGQACDACKAAHREHARVKAAERRREVA